MLFVENHRKDAEIVEKIKKIKMTARHFAPNALLLSVNYKNA